MKIVLDEAYRAGDCDRFHDCTVRFLPRNLATREAVCEAIGDAEVLGLRSNLPFPVDDEFLAPLSNLRFIQKSGTGVDSFDIAALSGRNVLLASNSGINAVAVAEHTLMLILMCLHQPGPHMESLRQGKWRASLPVPTPTQIAGKTVGIIGLGGIGKKVAEFATSMGAHVIAVTRNPNTSHNIVPGVTEMTLEELLQQADVVTLHVPLTDATNGLLGAQQFDMMKPGSVLINTSRGKVVDEQALFQALKSGKLAGAGLDVFEDEPTQQDNPLLSMENVYATPHVGGFTVESNEAQIEGSLSNIERFVQGLQPERLVNAEVWSRNVR